MFGKHNAFVSKARVSACMYFLVVIVIDNSITTPIDYWYNVRNGCRAELVPSPRAAVGSGIK
jgi:hypothetical protein